MKKTFSAVTATVLAIISILSFSSCSLFATMRDYSMKASQVEIFESPEDEALFNQYKKALGVSAEEAQKLSCSASYNVKNIKVEAETENTDTKLINKSASTLSKLILANKPGAESKEIAPVDYTGTLLEKFNAASSLSYTASRNTANEAVTNEKGEEATDEAGNVVREVKIKDNIDKVDFLFYNDTVTEEAYTDEAGNDVKEVTERAFADAALIESVFGAPADKAAVLAEFEAVKDYITVDDYTFTYDACKVHSEFDIEKNLINSVNFEKIMVVTAEVTGKGIFADCGKMTVTFNLIKSDNFSFTYPAEE